MANTDEEVSITGWTSEYPDGRAKEPMRSNTQIRRADEDLTGRVTQR